jgi:protease I
VDAANAIAARSPHKLHAPRVVLTSYKSIKTDVINAGGHWKDSEVVTDNGVITSRNPGDLEAFVGKIIEEVKEGKHQRRAA